MPLPRNPREYQTSAIRSSFQKLSSATPNSIPSASDWTSSQLLTFRVLVETDEGLNRTVPRLLDPYMRPVEKWLEDPNIKNILEVVNERKWEGWERDKVLGHGQQFSAFLSRLAEVLEEPFTSEKASGYNLRSRLRPQQLLSNFPLQSPHHFHPPLSNLTPHSWPPYLPNSPPRVLRAFYRLPPHQVPLRVRPGRTKAPTTYEPSLSL
jgi:hypothetical protein